MADFKIKNQKGKVIQQGDLIYNGGQSQVSPSVKSQLQSLLTEIATLAQSGAVNQQISNKLRNPLLAAVEEANAPAPRAHRLESLLNSAKEISAGLSATLSIAEAIDRVISVLNGGA